MILDMTNVADLLDDWATAIRVDWGSIDGRTCRTELNELSAYLRGERDLPTHEDIGVCVEGEYGAHWSHWGDDHE